MLLSAPRFAMSDLRPPLLAFIDSGCTPISKLGTTNT
jgi:hypothetical protein